jgi:hypothetical protein
LRPDGDIGANFALMPEERFCCQYFLKTLRPTWRYAGKAASVRCSPMIKRTFSLPVIFLLFTLAASAQDPLKVAPQAYKLEFENEWVKVMRVHYGPHEKIPAHDHTERAAAYVYLNDGGPVIFKHIGLAYGAVTRPATKAGSFGLYKALKEVHEVENTSDLPSDFLRVEFKTRMVDEKTLRGRFHREPWPAGENYQKTQFEDEQIRVTRLVCAPGKSLDVPAGASGPSLLITLSPARLSMIEPKGKDPKLNLGLGQMGWQPAGKQASLESPGGAPAELLLFEFKTGPVDAQEEKPKTHDHPRE